MLTLFSATAMVHHWWCSEAQEHMSIVKLKSLSPYVSDNDLDVIVIDVDVVYDYSNNDKEQL